MIIPALTGSTPKMPKSVGSKKRAIEVFVEIRRSWLNQLSPTTIATFGAVRARNMASGE